jgi:hypothetical protein
MTRLFKGHIAMREMDGSDGDAEEDDSDDDEEAVPFVCFLCREPFVDLVVSWSQNASIISVSTACYMLIQIL